MQNEQHATCKHRSAVRACLVLATNLLDGDGIKQSLVNLRGTPMSSWWSHYHVASVCVVNKSVEKGKGGHLLGGHHHHSWLFLDRGWGWGWVTSSSPGQPFTFTWKVNGSLNCERKPPRHRDSNPDPSTVLTTAPLCVQEQKLQYFWRVFTSFFFFLHYSCISSKAATHLRTSLPFLLLVSSTYSLWWTLTINNTWCHAVYLLT